MAGQFTKIVLGGASYQMKPAYGVWSDIEGRTGLTIGELLELVLVERLKYEEAALIVWFGCQAAGEDFDSIEAVGDAIFEMRLTNVGLRKSLSQFLLSGLWAPAEAKKKFDEEVAPALGIGPVQDGTG